MIVDDNSRLHIQVDSLDLEYELNELLPGKTLEELCRNALEPPVRLAVCLPDGTTYFELGRWEAADKSTLTGIIAKNRPRPPCVTEVPDSGRLAVFPLKYELEIKGYLAVFDGRPAGRDVAAWGKVCVNTLLKLMHLKHQTLMTSNLHGMVVHESYEQLADKAAQLERSEEKYRHLAANLEIEVQKRPPRSRRPMLT